MLCPRKPKNLEVSVCEREKMEDTKRVIVLVSARIELIFFLVAGIVLCFGFRMRIMLITH